MLVGIPLVTELVDKTKQGTADDCLEYTEYLICLHRYLGDQGCCFPRRVNMSQQRWLYLRWHAKKIIDGRDWT